MIIALDIDDTITAVPGFFSAITRSTEVSKVIIVSSRSNLPEVREATKQELEELGIAFDSLHLLESYEAASESCPYPELDWYEKYLWQKVDICIREGVDIMFDDDPKVAKLFNTYAPDIRFFQIY